ncbi:MAG: TraX family protein [Lachnospiraceae bacterium]|nr:TraX family protein [Lachnospiraceae bacterium]
MFLYNGERGSESALAKYFFYVFYPLHLWIIYSVKLIMVLS